MQWLCRFCVLTLLLAGTYQARAGHQTFADEISAAAQLPPLATSPLPPGAVELRLWTGFGVVVPHHMLRLQRSDAGKISGELLRHFPRDLAYMGDEAAGFRREATQRCAVLRGDTRHEVCTLAPRHPPNWRRVYDSLVRLGVATLPDDSLLPPPLLEMNDGFSMHVEVRQGGEYRYYSYSNPAVRDQPEARAALKIAGVVSALLDSY